MIDQVEGFISDPWHVQPHIDAFKDMSLRYAIESSSDHQKAIKHHTACWAAAEKLLAAAVLSCAAFGAERLARWSASIAP